MTIAPVTAVCSPKPVGKWVTFVDDVLATPGLVRFALYGGVSRAPFDRHSRRLVLTAKRP